MPPAEGSLPLRHAVALGLLQGPAELLPVSSSAHTTLIPWLSGWPYARLHAGERKSFELALHAGTAAALALAMRSELRAAASRPLLLALAAGPPAAAGLLLRPTVERRLGGPRAAAAGLLAGSLAMALAERRPGARRGCEEVGAADALALGLAQACALAPGVSRSGSTLAAARVRGFGPRGARTLSWAAALPVLLGAGAVESVRLARGRSDAPRAAAAAGGLAAFASTLASALALRRAPGRLAPYAVYRVLLAGAVLRRVRRAQ
jgi:undecaprenyl-diphosphatase